MNEQRRQCTSFATHLDGMLAAAEIAKKFEPDERDGVYFPSDAIREAAKK